MSETTFPILKKLPGSLSLQRGSMISDGLMYSGYADPTQKPTPLNVIYHGIRGTQNVAGDKGKGSAVGNARGREVSNVQHTESAKLGTGADYLLVEFSVRFLDLKHVLFACAPSKTDLMEDIQQFKRAFHDFVARSKTSQGLQHIAARYARNIANARWLWRNRVTAESIRVEILVGAETTPRFCFDALSIPLNHFNDFSEHELALAKIVAAQLGGESDDTLRVRAKVDFGMGNVEVFPSQNYLEEKPKGFSRSLYKIGIVPLQRHAADNQELGQAALRDQKIGNALRTIDTWYPQYAERQLPIPVEPNGASLEAQEFFRSKKTSAFDLMKQIGTLDPNSDDGMFMLACLVRGGVYSEGES
jgi:CRISPR-associated protein Csy3